MVKTHETVREFDSQEKALEYIRSEFDTVGDVIDKFAVSADGLGYSPPALSYEVSDEEIRYVHALSTGHVVVRFNKDSGRGYGPHSDQKSRRGGSNGHPR